MCATFARQRQGGMMQKGNAAVDRNPTLPIMQKGWDGGIMHKANESRRPRPDSGLGFQVKVLDPFKLFPLRSKAANCKPQRTSGSSTCKPQRAGGSTGVPRS